MTTVDGRRILSVGLVCVDIVVLCDYFPQEDSDQRVPGHRWNRGGNASNTATVLSRLGAPVELLGTIADSSLYKNYILDNLKAHGIISDRCPIIPGVDCPLSFVILNSSSGSRTILHSNKNLPEVREGDFLKLPDLSQTYNWIHFEGRPNVKCIADMIRTIDACNASAGGSKIITSVELEKRRPELGELLDKCDYVFISRDFSEFLGYTNKEDVVKAVVHRTKPGAALICAWGAEGASAIRHEPDACPINVASCPPHVVVDTIGAGDTFNAAVIFALLRNFSLSEAVQYGCRVAGAKCGEAGLENINPPPLTKH